jgi:putative membrane protein
MAALYFTPLCEAMPVHPEIHSIVDLQFFYRRLSLRWVIAGPDPSPHRPSVPARLVVLGLAVVIHSVLSQLLYAGWHIAVPAPVAQPSKVRN